MTRSARAVVVCAALIALLGARPTPASALRIEGPFGSGSAQVWLLRPAGEVKSVVVFGHGWKLWPPSIARPWVRQFAPWLDHLVRAGNAVVFPRYQLGGDTPGAARADAYRQGLVTGFSRLGRPAVPVVAAGYSYGASLAFYYAADARRWGLPEPAAVDAVFPAGMISGVALPPLPASVRVLIQVGDRDTEAGSGGAAAFWAWLNGHAQKRYQTVVSRNGFSAEHKAPKETTPAARRAFWAPLDALIAAARRT